MVQHFRSVVWMRQDCCGKDREQWSERVFPPRPARPDSLRPGLWAGWLAKFWKARRQERSVSVLPDQAPVVVGKTMGEAL